MNDALKNLVAKHPTLFGDQEPDGELPPGWFSIADGLMAGMERILGADVKHVRIISVEDEFGTLSVPYTFDPAHPVNNEAVLELRDEAERRSNKTCCLCGKPGSRVSFDGRRQALCPQHAPDMTDQIEPNLLRLMNEHPVLFRGVPPVVPSSVSSGWFQLIDKLFGDIEVVLSAEGSANFQCMQIKEKFGSLRVYYRLGEAEDLHVDLFGPSGRQHLVAQRGQSGEDEAVKKVRELVNAACVASENICQRCGEPAKLQNLDGYYATLCSVHQAEYLKRWDPK